MTFKRKLFFLSLSLFVLGNLIFIVMTALYFSLPLYIETVLLPMLAKSINIYAYECDIRRIGIWGTDISNITLGAVKPPGLAAASIRINYDPRELLHRRLKSIAINGINIRINLKDGQIIIPGLSPDFFKSKPKDNPKPLSLPVLIDNLKIGNASLTIEKDQHEYHLPFAVEISADKTTSSRFNLLVKVQPRGQTIAIKARIDIDEQTAQFEIDSHNIQLDRFGDFLPQGLILRGDLNLKGQAGLKLNPFQIMEASAHGEMRIREATYNQLRLARKPLNFSIIAKDMKNITIKVKGLSMEKPRPLKLDRFQADLKITPAGFKVKGGLDLSARALKIKTMFQGRLKNQQWDFILKTKFPVQSIRFQEITADLTVFKIAAKGNKTQAQIDYELEIADGNFISPINLQIPLLQLDGSLKINDLKNIAQYDLDFNLTGSQICLDKSVQVGELFCDGEYKPGQDDFLIKGVLFGRDTNIIDTNFEIKGIDFSMPLTWPFQHDLAEGHLLVESIFWNDKIWGGLSGQIRQTPAGLMVKTIHKNKLISALELETCVNIPLPFEGVDINCKMPFFQTKGDLDLSLFAPDAKGMLINGGFTGHGAFNIDSTGANGSFSLSLEKVDFKMPDNKVLIENMQTQLTIPEIASMHSLPKQKFSFKKASIGAVHFSQGEIEYQIESPTNFVIDNLKIKWCHGIINSHAIRIDTENSSDNYDLTLYCDRLNLAEVLEQLGAAKAEGRGTVNGKIPVKYHGGKIIFEDGFLYSTPDEGGVIYMSEAEILTTGIPKGTLQYAQIDLAVEALKNFEYKWVKLNLDSGDADLKMQLKFNGVPHNPLPFIFDKKIGGFMRVKGRSQSSRFQGIRLDVNVNLPLDKVMELNNIFNSRQ